MMAIHIPDANILINALRKESPHHPFCRKWLDEINQREEELGLCELVEVGLLRIGTLSSLKIAPIEEVLGFWNEDLLGYSKVRRLTPGGDHTRIFTQFVTDLNLRGNDMNDAWLAALAIEHRATLVSLDAGFARFPRLDWLNPLTDL